MEKLNEDNGEPQVYHFRNVPRYEEGSIMLSHFHLYPKKRSGMGKRILSLVTFIYFFKYSWRVCISAVVLRIYLKEKVLDILSNTSVHHL